MINKDRYSCLEKNVSVVILPLENREFPIVTLEVLWSVGGEGDLDVEAVRHEVYDRRVTLVSAPFYTLTTDEILNLPTRKKICTVVYQTFDVLLNASS